VWVTHLLLALLLADPATPAPDKTIAPPPKTAVPVKPKAERSWADSGPVALMNGNPVHAVFLDQPLVDPALPQRGRLEFRITEFSTCTHSSNFLGTPAGATLNANYLGHKPQTLLDHASLAATAAATSGQVYMFLDTETSRLDLDGTYPFGRHWGVNLDVPVMGHSGGAFDWFIRAYHQTLGFPDLGRGLAPMSRSQLFIASGSQSRFFDGSSAPELGDIVLRGLYAPLLESRHSPAALIHADIKLPSGCPSHFMGSGAMEYGLGVSLAKGVGQWRFYTGLGYTIHNHWAGLGNIPVTNTLDGHFGIEWRSSKRWSLQAQMTRQEQALAPAKPSDVGEAAYLVGTTMRYRVSDRLSWEFGLLEDLKYESAMDAALQFRIICTGL
jgi:hypothetical protein